MSYMFDFKPHDKTLVLKWLVNQMLDDDWNLSPDNLACRKPNGKEKYEYRWRIAKNQKITEFYLNLN